MACFGFCGKVVGGMGGMGLDENDGWDRRDERDERAGCQVGLALRISDSNWDSSVRCSGLCSIIHLVRATE